MKSRFDFFDSFLEFCYLLAKVGDCGTREMIRLIDMETHRFCMTPHFVYYLDCLIGPTISNLRFCNPAQSEG